MQLKKHWTRRTFRCPFLRSKALGARGWLQGYGFVSFGPVGYSELRIYNRQGWRYYLDLVDLKFQRMKYILSGVWLFLAIGLMSSALDAAPKWQRLETDGFTIYSDASATDIKEFAVNYTAFRQVMTDFFMPAGRKLAPSIFILFRKESSLKKYGPVSEDDDFNLLTFTAQVDGSALLAVAISGDRDRACEMVFEFETVLALQRAGYFLPTWMTQGTGMVLSNLEVGKDRCSFGADIDGYSDLFMNQGKQLPWDEFFRTGRDSDEYKGRSAGGIFHAQAWALMHWVLLSQKNPGEQFAKLAAAIREKGYLESVEEITGVKARNLSVAVGKHLSGRVPTFECAFDAQKVRMGFQLVPAPEAELHVQFANLLVAAGRHDEASKELEQATALAPDLISAKEAAARQALRNQQNEDAVNLYRAAIAGGSKNPIAYLISAGARLDEYSMGNADYEGGGGPSTEVAIGEIRKALEINPGSMQAYRLLGRAFYILPKFTEDRLADLAPALVKGAEGCDVRYYRALLYRRLGKIEECMNDLRLIIDDPDASQRNKRSANDHLTRLEKQLKKATPE